jgi:hypothetical protein
MSEPKLENDCALIIDPAVLADIRAQCQRRRAELEASGQLPPLRLAPGCPVNAPGPSDSAIVAAKAATYPTTWELPKLPKEAVCFS